MVSNNQYYKSIAEQLNEEEYEGTHNDTYYLIKILESYNITYPRLKCKGKYLKDWYIRATGNTVTGSHPNGYYLKNLAEHFLGYETSWMTENRYLKTINELIGVVKENTTLSWTPPTNLVYSDEFNATGVLTCNNQPVEGETVYLMIGSYVAGTDVTDSDGSVSFTATPVHAGRHTFSLVYRGSKSYYGCENSATIDVSKETSFLNMTNKNTFYTNEDVILTGVLLDDEQEPIVGKYVAPFGVTDSNGVFSANMGRVNVGTYTFNDITFTDDDYTGNTISHTIQVVEPYLDLEADKPILSYEDRDTATLTATVHNKTVNGVTVTFYDGNDNVIGTGTTNSDGVAVCNNPYESQGLGDVTLRAEASVDGILVSKTFDVEDCSRWDTCATDNTSNYYFDLITSVSGMSSSQTLSFNTDHYEAVAPQNNASRYLISLLEQDGAKYEISALMTGVSSGDYLVENGFGLMDIINKSGEYLLLRLNNSLKRFYRQTDQTTATTVAEISGSGNLRNTWLKHTLVIDGLDFNYKITSSDGATTIWEYSNSFDSTLSGKMIGIVSAFNSATNKIKNIKVKPL